MSFSQYHTHKQTCQETLEEFSPGCGCVDEEGIRENASGEIHKANSTLYLVSKYGTIKVEKWQDPGTFGLSRPQQGVPLK